MNFNNMMIRRSPLLPIEYSLKGPPLSCGERAKKVGQVALTALATMGIGFINGFLVGLQGPIESGLLAFGPISLIVGIPLSIVCSLVFASIGSIGGLTVFIGSTFNYEPCSFAVNNMFEGLPIASSIQDDLFEIRTGYKAPFSF